MYTYDQIQKIALQTQCCLATISTDLLFAERGMAPKRFSLETDFLFLVELLDILLKYKPVDYVYTENNYEQTEDDQCITDDDLQYVIEEINSICSCSCCQDAQDLLKDI